MKELFLAGGQVALVDEDVFAWASHHRWRRHSDGCIRRTIYFPGGRRGTGLLHREILEAPPDLEVWHRSDDKLDNRRENLVALRPNERGNRQALRHSTSGRRPNNTSGYREVSWNRRRQVWEAGIVVSGKRRHLGYFHTAEVAARAWDRAAQKTWGDAAYQNLAQATQSTDDLQEGTGLSTAKPAPDASR